MDTLNLWRVHRGAHVAALAMAHGGATRDGRVAVAEKGEESGEGASGGVGSYAAISTGLCPCRSSRHRPLPPMGTRHTASTDSDKVERRMSLPGLGCQPRGPKGWVTSPARCPVVSHFLEKLFSQLISMTFLSILKSIFTSCLQNKSCSK